MFCLVLLSTYVQFSAVIYLCSVYNCYLLFCFYVNECSRGKAGQGIFAIHPGNLHFIFWGQAKKRPGNDSFELDFWGTTINFT